MAAALTVFSRCVSFFLGTVSSRGDPERCKLTFEPGMKSTLSRICRAASQLLFDPQELVVFRCALAAARRPSFDLARACGDSEVGNGHVLSLARAMRYDCCIAGIFREFHRLQRLCQAADLVNFDEN